MSSKTIPAEHIADVRARIERGEKPRKMDENQVSPKEFIQQMLPHVKTFLVQGYTYREIAEFLGQVSVGDLKKALEKDAPVFEKKKEGKEKNDKKDKKAGREARATVTTSEQAPQAPASQAARIPCKGCKGRKAPQPSVS